MEEGEFHQGIPFREEGNKGQESLQQPWYTDRSLDKSLGLSILAKTWYCKSSQNENWLCTDNSDTKIRMQQAGNTWHQVS